MKKSLFQKIFIGIALGTAACGVLAYIFTSMAERTDPHYMEKVFMRLGQRMGEGKNYDEFAEEDLHDIKRLRILNANADLEIQRYDGDTLKISYTGKIPKGEEARLIEVDSHLGTTSVRLGFPEHRSFFHFQWNNNIKGINYSDAELTAKLYIPRNYTGSLDVRTAKGNVDLTDLHLNDLNVKSALGDVEIENVQAQDLQIDMVAGELNCEGSRADRWDIKSVRGNVNLSLEEGRKYHFELASVNGHIQNKFVPDESQASKTDLIKIKTVSGDILIDHYNESADDRE